MRFFKIFAFLKSSMLKLLEYGFYIFSCCFIVEMRFKIFSRFGRTSFKRIPVKHANEMQLRDFWQNLDSGQIHGERLHPKSHIMHREVFQVTPELSGTVRKFRNESSLMHYINLGQTLVEQVEQLKPKHFELHPIQAIAIDLEKFRLLERVYPVPSATDFFVFQGRTDYSKYWPKFRQEFESKGINLEEAQELVRKAYDELSQLVWDGKLRMFDYNMPNVLVFQIDAKRKKVLFGLTDIFENPKPSKLGL